MIPRRVQLSAVTLLCLVASGTAHAEPCRAGAPRDTELLQKAERRFLHRQGRSGHPGDKTIFLPIDRKRFLPSLDHYCVINRRHPFGPLCQLKRSPASGTASAFRVPTEVHFVITKGWVNFYEFAHFFRDGLGYWCIGRKARRQRNTAARGRNKERLYQVHRKEPIGRPMPLPIVAPMLGGSVLELSIYSGSYWLDPSDIRLVSASCPYTAQSRCQGSP